MKTVASSRWPPFHTTLEALILRKVGDQKFDASETIRSAFRTSATSLCEQRI